MRARHWVIAPLIAVIAVGCASKKEASVSTEQPRAAGVSEIAMDTGTGGLLRDLEATMDQVALKRVWSHSFFQLGEEEHVESALVEGPDLLVVTRNPESGEGRLHLIDARRGVHRWEVAIGTSPLVQPPSASGAFAIVLTEDGCMQAVSRRTGSRSSRAFRAKLGKIIPTAPAAGTQTSVFVASLTDDRIHCLDPATGASGWHWTVKGKITTGPLVTPTVPRSLTVVGTDAGHVVALAPQPWNKGKPESATWRYRVLDEISAPMGYGQIVRKDRVLPSILVASRDNGLYCLDATSGEPRWTEFAKTPFVTQPRACGELVVTRNAAGLQAFNLENGKAAWAPGSDASAWDHALTGDAKRIYVAKGSKIARVVPQTGVITAEADLAGFHAIIGASHIDLLIGVGMDGSIVAYR